MHTKSVHQRLATLVAVAILSLQLAASPLSLTAQEEEGATKVERAEVVLPLVQQIKAVPWRGWIDDESSMMVVFSDKPTPAIILNGAPWEGGLYPPPDRWEEYDKWLVAVRKYFASNDHHRMRGNWLQYADAYVEFDLFEWRNRGVEAFEALQNGWPEEGGDDLATWLGSFAHTARLMYGGNARPVQPPDEPHYDLPPAEGFYAPSAERLDAMAIMAAVGARQREPKGEFHAAAVCYNTALVFSARLWQPWMPLYHTVAAYNRIELIFRGIDDSLAKNTYPPAAAGALLTGLNMLEADLPTAKSAIEADLFNFWQVLETVPLDQMLYEKVGTLYDVETYEKYGGEVLDEAAMRAQYLELRPAVEDAYMRVLMDEGLTKSDLEAMPDDAVGLVRYAVEAVRAERHIRERIEGLRAQLIELQNAGTQ